MRDSVIMARRFNGPPNSGHGGYVCGIVSGLLGGAAEVTLRRPPPLEAPLLVRETDDGHVHLTSGDNVVATGVRATLDLCVPDDLPTLDVAVAAARRYPGFDRHSFPTCFACGPARDDGDGLRIFSGLVPGRDVFAAPWIPHASLRGSDGYIRTEFVWAALDCPSGWTATLFDPGPFLLGRLTASLLGGIEAGQPYITLGWPLNTEGRKLFTGSAILTPAGEPLAVARAVWFHVA